VFSRSYLAVPVALRLARSAAVVMSRVAVLLLLLLVCCRSPSNADVLHAVDAIHHPVAPATSDVIHRVANARKAENKAAESGDGDDDRKWDDVV